MNRSEVRQLIKIVTLYYDKGMKQADIAKALNLSQSQVSRAITKAQKEGYVKISVVQPPYIFIELEQQLQASYGIAQVIVVDIPDGAGAEQIQKEIGSMAAHYIQTTLAKDDLVGITSWSETIRKMVDAMHPLPNKASGVIQILGGVGQNNNLQATLVTHSLSHMLGCPSYLLPAMSIERSIEDKQRLASSPDVAEVLSKFKDIDVALVGIGPLEPSEVLRNSGNYYDEDVQRLLNEKGAVGNICLHYYDQDGEPVLCDDEDPVMSMSLAELKECPRVIALAGGEEKVDAIRGALAGGLLDVLITDRVTAEALVR